MSAPHHGCWDSLALDVPPRDFDRPLPLLGKLGQNIRRRRGGMGHALGKSFHLLHKASRTDLCSPRFRVLFRRNWTAMLLPFVYLGIFALLVIFMMASKSMYAIAAWVLYCTGMLAYGSLKKAELQAWPSLAMKLRRQALLYSSNRFRRLHPESGQDQTPEQIAFYVAHRREHWLGRINSLGYAERNALAYREHWWLALLPFGALIPIMLSTANIYRLGPALFPSMLLFYVLMFGLPTLLARHRLKRFRTSLTDFTCPDCGYPLADFSEGAFRNSPVRGLGPRICNECGTPWPLLPPPISRTKPKRATFTRSLFARRSDNSAH